MSENELNKFPTATGTSLIKSRLPIVFLGQSSLGFTSASHLQMIVHHRQLHGRPRDPHRQHLFQFGRSPRALNYHFHDLCMALRRGLVQWSEVHQVGRGEEGLPVRTYL